jgi:hypothetical protein
VGSLYDIALRAVRVFLEHRFRLMTAEDVIEEAGLRHAAPVAVVLRDLADADIIRENPPGYYLLTGNGIHRSDSA